MTQQAETRSSTAEKRERRRASKVDAQFKMVQGIRREIIDMLASKKRGFSAEDYELLGVEGILHEDDRVELIDGEIVPMAPIGSRHAACVNMLSNTLSEIIGERAIIAVQNPINLSGNSEPQPDIALLRPRNDFYASAHPNPEDILLLIEVADSSLERDRKKTTANYAKYNVHEVWIVNLIDDCVERYHSPSQGEYGNVSLSTRGDAISPEQLPNVELGVDDILP